MEQMGTQELVDQWRHWIRSTYWTFGYGVDGHFQHFDPGPLALVELAADGYGKETVEAVVVGSVREEWQLFDKVVVEAEGATARSVLLQILECSSEWVFG